MNVALVRNGVIFSVLQKHQLDYVIQNLRTHDKLELEVFGITPDNAWDEVNKCNENICAEVYGEPVCIFGYVITLATIRFNFFSTNKVNGHWLQITRGAREYIRYYMKQHPTRKGVIEVWEGHNESRKWLRFLGFEETGAYRRTKKGRMIFVQYNKYNNNRRTK